MSDSYEDRKPDQSQDQMGTEEEENQRYNEIIQ